MKTLRIGYLNLPWVLDSELPVLLGFIAGWDVPSIKICSYLRMMGEKYDGKLITGFVDVDYATRIFTQFKITDFPSLLGIDGGKPLKPLIGVKTLSEVEEYIQYIFGVLPYSPMEKY